LYGLRYNVGEDLKEEIGSWVAWERKQGKVGESRIKGGIAKKKKKLHWW
jgi:hypothetical protein